MLEQPPQMAEPESEIIQDIMRMMSLARDELVNAQSARDPAGLNKFDSGRLMAIVDKIEAYIINYVQAATPLDLPESAPLEAMTGPGRRGVAGGGGA